MVFNNLAARAKSFLVKTGVVSVGSMESFAWEIIGPWSIFSSIKKMVTPLVFSAFKIAEATGEGPRYLGKSEGWMQRQPYLGILRMDGDRILL